MKTSDNIEKLAGALCQAQSAMTGAKKGANNPFFKSNYSDLAMVIEAINQPFSDNGLCFVQGAEMNENRVSVVTRIIHISGQWIESETQLPPTKNDAQGVGSAISYAKRYGLQALAGVPSVDDDGNQAVKQQKPAQKKAVISNEMAGHYAKSMIEFANIDDNSGLNELKSELNNDQLVVVWGLLPSDVRSKIKKMAREV